MNLSFKLVISNRLNGAINNFPGTTVVKFVVIQVELDFLPTSGFNTQGQ